MHSVDCPFCHHIAKTETRFIKHKNKKHPYDKFGCSLCAFKTGHFSKWKRHKAKLHELQRESRMSIEWTGEILCPFCTCSAADKVDFVSHKRICHPADRMECGFCDFTSRFWKNLNKHMDRCQYKTTASQEKLVRSPDLTMKITHYDAKSSNDAFNNATNNVSNGDLEKREQNHNSAKEPSSCSQKSFQFHCDICQKSFKNNQRLERHRQQVHSDLRPFVCCQCPATYKRKEDLTAHHRTHTQKKPYVCSHCNFKTTMKKILVGHIQFHMNFKPHKCQFCDYASVKKSNLTRHVKRHLDDKKFQCTECDYASISSDKLKQHFSRHTGEKPYACAECPKTFATHGNLRNHTREAHKIILEPKFTGVYKFFKQS